MSDATSKAVKRREGRSPGYPYFPIQKAIERIQELFSREGNHSAPLSSAVGAWGYSPKSSGGRQTLATMRYYGLIEVSGEGDARMVRVSEVARKILLDKREDDTERRALIRQVALMPLAHRTLYQKYPDGLASDGTVHHFLVFERGYNDEAARELLAEFKLTASQIGLYQPSQGVDNLGETGQTSEDESELPKVKVGDRIQSTVGGVDMFPNGAIVLGFSDDGKYAFTDQSDAGSPMEGVTVIEVADPAAIDGAPKRPAHLVAERKQADTLKPGQRKAIFPVSDGDVVLEFPEGISAASLKTLGKYLNIFLEEEIEKKNPA